MELWKKHRVLILRRFVCLVVLMTSKSEQLLKVAQGEHL